MTRAVPSQLLADYQQQTTTLAWILQITRQLDGVTVGYTTLNADLVVSGMNYEAGLDVSNIQTVAGFQVGNFDVTIFPDAVFNAPDLLAGKWNGAFFQLSIVNWKQPSHGIDTVKSGYTGEAKITETGGFTLEFRGLMQAFQQPLGQVTQKTCRTELGAPDCTVNLTFWTQIQTITSITSPHVYVCSAATPPTDYYTEGFVLFLTGLNTNYKLKVKQYTAPGIFTFVVPPPFAVAVGDTFSATAGCQKRWDVDCRDKFLNILNFQGEKDVPGQDLILANPVPT